MYLLASPESSAWTLSARGASCMGMIISTSWILSPRANFSSSSRRESSVLVRTVYDWQVRPSVPPRVLRSAVQSLCIAYSQLNVNIKRRDSGLTSW